MASIISIALFSTFLFLSGIHFYWGTGGRWGSQAVFPTQDDHVKPDLPGAFPCFIVALGLLGMGIFVLSKGVYIDLHLPAWIDNFGLWIIAAIFIIRAVGDFKYVGFFSKIRHTAFGKNDRKYYSPLCLAIGVLALILQNS